jgi:hypothetical protein
MTLNVCLRHNETVVIGVCLERFSGRSSWTLVKGSTGEAGGLIGGGAKVYVSVTNLEYIDDLY